MWSRLVLVAACCGAANVAAAPVALAKVSGYPDANIRRMAVIVQNQIE